MILSLVTRALCLRGISGLDRVAPNSLAPVFFPQWADGTLALNCKSKALPRATQQEYAGKAVAENAELLRVLKSWENNPQPFEKVLVDLEQIPATRNRMRTLKRWAATSSMKRLLEHRTWTAGLGIECFDSALAPAHVNTQLSQVTMADKVKALFLYDPNVRANPEHMPRSFIPCHVKYGGLCEQDALCSKATIATANVYHCLRRWNPKWKATLPLLVKFTDETQGLRTTASEYTFLAQVFGKGDLGFCCVAKPEVLSMPEQPPVLLASLGEDGEGADDTVALTTHQIVSRILSSSTDDPHYLTFEMFDTKRHVPSYGCTVEVVKIASSQRLSLTNKETGRAAAPAMRPVAPVPGLFGFIPARQSADDMQADMDTGLNVESSSSSSNGNDSSDVDAVSSESADSVVVDASDVEEIDDVDHGDMEEDILICIIYFLFYVVATCSLI